MKLYSYFRSSSSYRVRIALYLKNIQFEYAPIHLIKEGGEQHLAEYEELNPSKEVPCLVHEGRAISQSMAILNYLDDIFPEPSLFPKEPYKKAQVIQLSEMINSGIQPIQNLKVLKEISTRFGLDQKGKEEWAQFWINEGFKPLERLLDKTSGQFSLGDNISAADLYLVPQVYNARRFKVNMDAFPYISQIEKNCLELDAFKKAEPSQQPDAPAS